MIDSDVRYNQRPQHLANAGLSYVIVIVRDRIFYPFLVHLDTTNSVPDKRRSLLRMNSCDESIKEQDTVIYIPPDGFVKATKSKSQKIGNHHGLDHYAVLLTKTSKIGAKIDRFAFGKADLSSRVQHKTILLMGVTGSGKTTLINAMINYIFKVRRYDQFRFQLVQKRPTNRIVVYDIHHDEDFNIPFSLTIIDTPSFVEDTEKNEAIVEMIRELFQGPRNIFDLNLFGLVAQASFPRLVDSQIQIMDSVSDIFGGDAKDHTNFLLTVSDEQVPPILKFLSKIGHPRPTKTVSGDSYAYNKFNSAGFFGEFSDKLAADEYPFWDMCVKNFEGFFNLLDTMEPIFQSSVTKWVN